MRVHAKLSPEAAARIKNGQSLLTPQDRNKVSEIQIFALNMQIRTAAIRERKQQLDALKNIRMIEELKLSDEVQFLESMVDDLDIGRKSTQAYLDKILAAIDEGYRIGESITDISSLCRYFGISPDQSDAKQVLLKRFTDIVAERKQQHYLVIEESSNLNDKIMDCDKELENYTTEVETYKETQGYEFDLDRNFQLLKITKKGNGPKYSVIFAQIDDKRRPFIVYEGKERKLGEGGFGTVKLAQDCYTNDLVAVKIQNINALPPDVLEQEKQMLIRQGRFRGSLTRHEDEKYYIVQQLHHGKNIKDLNITRLTDKECLMLLRSATVEVERLHHKNQIHRDIKLENFMWDGEYNYCDLIDLAFIETVDGDEPKRKHDEAGSDEYKSPEVIEQGLYSKRSDIYAFGQMINEIVETHPHLHKQLKPQIDKMMAPLESRTLNLQGFISKLNFMLKMQDEKPKLQTQNNAAQSQRRLSRSAYSPSYKENIKQVKVLKKARSELELPPVVLQDNKRKPNE